tara:strand:+ start:1839 stop:2630 length:792 start_codon:yes stop_codon:yes gene_type:complete
MPFPFTIFGASRSSNSGGGGLANTLCADFGGGYLEAATSADHSYNGNIDPPAAGASISFSLWVYLGTTAGSQTLISKFGGVDGYNLSIDSDELNFSIWDQPVSSDDGLWYKTNNTPLALNQWQHIVAIFDNPRASPVGLARIYVDGVDTNAVVDATYDRFLGNAYTATKFRLGSRGAGTPGIVFGGKMDEVSIWSKALTEGEVEAIFDAGITPTTADLTGESGLESWYRFKSTDDFTGTAGGIVDELGNSDLTAGGTVSSAAV